MSFSSTLLLASLAAQIALPSSVCVSVIDPAKYPLRDATVTVTALLEDKREVQNADDKGAACFKDLPEGWYVVEAGGVPGFLNVRYYPVRLVPERTMTVNFELPIGETTEGGVNPDALVAGTLKLQGKPVAAAQICFKRRLAASSAQCVHTTGNGEYVLYILPGDYQVDITAGERASSSALRVAAGATYRNRLTFK